MAYNRPNAATLTVTLISKQTILSKKLLLYSIGFSVAFLYSIYFIIHVISFTPEKVSLPPQHIESTKIKMYKFHEFKFTPTKEMEKAIQGNISFQLII